MQRIDIEKEFLDPNLNYEILLRKLRSRIINLEYDVKEIKDPIVKGFAEKELIKMRETYFGYLKTDLELQHLMLTNPEIYGRDDKDV